MMKVFIITTKDARTDIFEEIKKHAEVVILDKEENDVDKYSEIIDDVDEKILGVYMPNIIEWTLPRGFLEKVKNLKGIATRSAWTDYIDKDYCRENNIPISHTPVANSQSVSEYAIWQLLCLTRKLPLQMEDGFKTFRDDEHTQTEVTGKTMGVIGLGNIGSRIAKLGEGMGMKVLYWNRSDKDVPYEYDTVENVLKRSDFVFNCLETCDETKGFLNKERLGLMKSSAYFVSVLGGAGWGVEDDDYLIEIVRKGKLAGMSAENEHKKGWKEPDTKGINVFFPGAYAWMTWEAADRMDKMFVEGVIGMLEGKKVNQVSL
ncbi:hypothetical protein JW710_04075 [Candidatus Dojkabacteria bacterium]|nr:hypothetical protein [Candidatus Dojkabacteria bacterium]